MRWLAIIFAVLIAALQYPMWLGKGGWLQVRAFDHATAGLAAVPRRADQALHLAQPRVLAADDTLHGRCALRSPALNVRRAADTEID